MDLQKILPENGPPLDQVSKYIEKYKNNLIVIKYGGNVFIDRNIFNNFIEDLSERDPTSIFNLFGLIPWDPPSFLIIGVWPCLMGLTMYLQQKLNPTPPDPIQQKIFMFFPLFLTIILAPFPSGLVIYWTINNVLTMAQQVVIMKQTKVKTT